MRRATGARYFPGAVLVTPYGEVKATRSDIVARNLAVWKNNSRTL